MDLPLGCISASGLPKATMLERSLLIDFSVHLSIFLNVWTHVRAISRKDVVLIYCPTTEEKLEKKKALLITQTLG